jgi:hypothetical protein
VCGEKRKRVRRFVPREQSDHHVLENEDDADACIEEPKVYCHGREIEFWSAADFSRGARGLAFSLAARHWTCDCVFVVAFVCIVDRHRGQDLTHDLRQEAILNA